MKRLSLLALATLLAIPAATAFAADPPAAPDMAAMMEAMAKAGKPGEQHKVIGKYVGDWTYSIKMWMDPNGPPSELSGTMHAEPMFGGRYVASTWKGEFMGAPFEGHGTDAYDNTAGQYLNTWIDNQGTGILYMTGTPSADGKSITYGGDMMDPMSGQKTVTKTVITWLSDDSFKNESFWTDPTGKLVPSMVIVATRKK
ncbi:MAG TPA: DUF1579 domain-containing protein [Thermoanaerobaculia bacterium]|jgi:hypothetical protein|nr:DUF1579 domain-containing protein [Thermoanaerobaculia bacterium]